MEDIRDFFKETDDSFTIYVVEQRFVVGRGSDYFRSFKGKENYIDTNAIMKKRLIRILQGINKRIPDSAELIKNCFNIVSPVGIVDIIGSLCKLFTTQEHQAAGPDVIDPIIIQEGDILPKYVNQIIALHKASILRPTIIILLKDNDFERAKKLLSNCPHDTNVKLIRNSGETELYKVINCGADNLDDFLDAFAHQCFSTCSHTKRSILYNNEWANNSIIKLYSPSMLKLRTDFLYQDKTLSRDNINQLIISLDAYAPDNESDRKLLLTLKCIARLYRVFCNDGGADDISEAYRIACTLQNSILLAEVYRYAYFLDGFSFDQKISLLDTAYKIFVDNKMEDNAIYCKNNRLVRFFDTDAVNINDFLTLLEEAIYNVPGLVGMAHIFNNVGVAHLMSGYPDEAIEYFDKGLDYTYRPERCIQKVALLCNRLIAKVYSYDSVNEQDLYKTLNLIFDNRELMNIPFISARYAVNIISIAFYKSKDLGIELLNRYPIVRLIQNAFKDNILGAGQLLLQINLLNQKFNIHLLDNIERPQYYIQTTGMKRKFLQKTNLNPFIFSTWF